MLEEIASARFHAVGWRVFAYAASVHFRTASFAETCLADAIGGLADESGHRAHLDLRATGLTVRLPVNEEARLTNDDVVLAGRISASAADLGAKVDVAGLQITQIVIDALVIPDIVPFWAAVLGYETGEGHAIDPDYEGPTVWFQQMDAPRPERNRIHIDVYLPGDQAEARIAAALKAGGRIVYDGHAPSWWTLADPEGNEVDVAPWPDTDD